MVSIQVSTPAILGGLSEGGSEVFKIDYFGSNAFLRQDPQALQTGLRLQAVWIESMTWVRTGGQKHPTLRGTFVNIERAR